MIAMPVEAVAETATPKSRNLTTELVRVDCARLDKLVDMIGEWQRVTGAIASALKGTAHEPEPSAV